VAQYHRTEGICLRRIDYSNTSQVASFVTPDAGLLSFLAKGATRAPKKGIRTGLDLLGRYEIVYTVRRVSSLLNLTSRWLREPFRGMRRSLPATFCGYYAAELLLNLTAEGQPCPELYELLLRALRSFASGEALSLNVLLLELGALREHGSCPAFNHCAGCSKALPARGAICFSPADGGPLCRHCERELHGAQQRQTTSVKADSLRTLALLSEGNPPEALGELAPDRCAAMSAVVRFHMRYMLGKELTMWRHLQQRRAASAAERGALSAS
jgi:DNA repair protein RecO